MFLLTLIAASIIREGVATDFWVLNFGKTCPTCSPTPAIDMFVFSPEHTRSVGPQDCTSMYGGKYAVMDCHNGGGMTLAMYNGTDTTCKEPTFMVHLSASEVRTMDSAPVVVFNTSAWPVWGGDPLTGTEHPVVVSEKQLLQIPLCPPCVELDLSEVAAIESNGYKVAPSTTCSM